MAQTAVGTLVRDRRQRRSRRQLAVELFPNDAQTIDHFRQAVENASEQP